MKMTKKQIREILESDVNKSKKMRALYAGGMEIGDIAKALGVRYNFVYNVIKTDAKKKGKEIRVGKKYGSKKAEIIALIEQGRTNVEIANETGSLYNYVFKVRKDYNLANQDRKMTVLVINGSPRKGGNTSLAIAEMKKIFDANGIAVEEVNVGGLDVRGCTACGKCGDGNGCVFNDIVTETLPKFKEAAGVVVASPVYYASPNGTLISFLDRLFYSAPFDKTMKVGASVAVARRGGCTATFDVLNKYFTISGMPVASSCYWNMVHGRNKGEAEQDAEGMQTMRILAENMVFLMKSIELGKKEFGLPKKEEKLWTNFVK